MGCLREKAPHFNEKLSIIFLATFNKFTKFVAN